MMPGKFANHYLPELMSFISGRPGPGSVSLNLTSRCNQHCIYCEIGNDIPTPSTRALTKEDVFWIIDEMAANKIRRLSLCGGEPFLFNGIIDVVAYAKKLNVHCAITTNGMTTHQLTDHELNILRKCNAGLNVSVDSFNAHTQNLTRGNSTAHSNALKTIERLQVSNIPVTILTVISQYNQHELLDLVKHAHTLKIKQVLFQPVIYHSNYPDREVLDQKANLNVRPENIDAIVSDLNKILDFERNHQIITNVYRILPWIKHYLQTVANPDGKWFFNHVLKKFHCRDVHAIIDITYDGGIQPCGLARAQFNIHENREQGLMTMWKDATLVLKTDLKNENYPDICNACCHHFSRNMIASIMKYPVSNRTMLFIFLRLLMQRLINRAVKTVRIKRV